MPVNFPPSPSPYAGKPPSDDPAAGRADDRTQAGAVRRGGAPEAIHPEAGGGLQLPDPVGGSTKNLFGTGGQVPLEPPPAGPADPSASKGLADKFQQAVDASGDEKYSFDAVLHLLLAVSVDEFKESQKQAQEDIQEKISELDASAQDMQSAASERLSGAIAAGAGAIVVGTLGLVGAGASTYGAVGANREISANATLDANSKGVEFTRLTSRTTGIGNTTQGVGQGLQGGMGILQGQDDAQASGDDAAKAVADKAAADDDSLHETALSMKQQYLSVMQDFLDKEKGWEQSQDQTMMTLARNV
jgi:hypothetical protein